MSLYRVAPNALWGWDPEQHVVEIETPAVDAAERVWRILVNREPVGFVVKRGKTEWDYFLGTTAPGANEMTRFVFPSPTRLRAVNALVETVVSRTEREYS